MSNKTQALQYVKNTNGGATKAHFMDDHKPIGPMLWDDLSSAGYVRTDKNGRIFLTEEGDAALAV